MWRVLTTGFGVREVHDAPVINVRITKASEHAARNHGHEGRYPTPARDATDVTKRETEEYMVDDVSHVTSRNVLDVRVEVGNYFLTTDRSSFICHVYIICSHGYLGHGALL